MRRRHLIQIKLRRNGKNDSHPHLRNRVPWPYS
jgi:hypothetical protein